MRILFFLFFLSGCSGLSHGIQKSGKSTYTFVDASGTFKLVRETKLLKQKIGTRIQLIDTKGSRQKVVEKSVLLSQIGSIKIKDKRLLTVRPTASEFTVWLEGKRYFSQMKIDTKQKGMRLTLESPEEKWRGTSLIKFPAGKYFCFYNQLPECLYHNYLLILAKENPNQKYDFYLIWDGYPFIQDQLSRVGQKLFAAASLKFDGEIKGLFRYIVEVEGQMILLQLTESFDLVKVAWITQGITIAPPGQAIVEDE